MIEQKVMGAIIQSRKAWDRVKSHLSKDDLSPQGQMWLELIRDYYARGDALYVDFALLKREGERKFPEKHRETLLGYIDNVDTRTSPDNVVHDLLEVKRFVVGNQLCAAIQDNDRKLEEIYESYGELMKATSLGHSEIKWTMDDDEMNTRLDRDNLIPIAPMELNQKCKGGAIRGDHIVIFGRPESGKTLFTVNMVGGFLKTGHSVLYIGNEEDTYKTRKRIVCNLANCTPSQYEEQTDKALERARERGLDKLSICHMQPGSIPEIDEVLAEVKPDVLVIDQIRNLYVPKADSMTVKLEKLGIEVRSLLSKHGCLGVSITQARDGETKSAWLTMEEMDSSRTGLPAQADLIVGVGVTEELIRNNQRALSLCKNKLNEDPDGRVGFMVRVDPARSKVK